MEASFRREGTPQAPGHEPPVDPGGGPSYGGLSLVARILRGRELAAEAAGIPPLDSDQVLDLQRTAGNQLTTGALARWIDGLQAAETAAALEPFARPGHAASHPPEVLLGLLAPAATHHPAAHAEIAAALTAMEPVIEVRLSCVGGEQLGAEIVLAGAEPAVDRPLPGRRLHPRAAVRGRLRPARRLPRQRDDPVQRGREQRAARARRAGGHPGRERSPGRHRDRPVGR